MVPSPPAGMVYSLGVGLCLFLNHKDVINKSTLACEGKSNFTIGIFNFILIVLPFTIFKCY